MPLPLLSGLGRACRQLLAPPHTCVYNGATGTNRANGVLGLRRILALVDLSLQLGQEQQLRVSPTLIVLNQLLALSSQELQQLVQQELTENPALELVEGHPCPSCGTPSVGPLCPFCEQPTAPQTTPAPTPKDAVAGDQIGDDYYDNYGENRHATNNQDDDGGEFDPMTLVASQPGRFDSLLSDVATMLSPDDRP